jgi:hypothetical protein
MFKLVSMPKSLLFSFMLPCDVRTRDNANPHPLKHPSTATPSPQNNAHFNMCRGACSSIVLTIWNIRHITSCILPLSGRWLQRRMVSGRWVPLCIVWRALLFGSATTLIYAFILQTFKYKSNSRPSVWFDLPLKNSLTWPASNSGSCATYDVNSG